MQAFDALATEYDAEFSHGKIGRVQRDKVHRYLLKVLNKDQNCLEINCGTGIDAQFLANKTQNLLACDASPKMIAEAQKNAPLIAFHELKIQEINQLGSERFDLVFSNFGGLNCLSPEELKTFFKDAYTISTKNAQMILVLMGKKCWWEQSYFLLKGEFKQAFRRKTSQSLAVKVGHEHIAVWYYQSREILALTGDNWELQTMRSTAFFIPPSYMESWAKKHPRMFNCLCFLDEIAYKIPFLGHFSDHTLLHFCKKQPKTRIPYVH